MIEDKRKQQNISTSDECEMSEAEIDMNLEDTFPASDPPSWTLGAKHCEDSPVQKDAGESRTVEIPEDEA